MTNTELLELRMKYGLSVAALSKVLHIRKEVVSQWCKGELPIPEAIGLHIEQRILDHNKEISESREVTLSPKSMDALKDMMADMISEKMSVIPEIKLSHKAMELSPQSIEKLEIVVSNVVTTLFNQFVTSGNSTEVYRQKVRELSRGNYGY